MKLHPLVPKILTDKDSSFSTVEELNDVLHTAIENGEIKNIALTGPFGSGKSSILQTLRKNFSDFQYLPISLATLLERENKGNNSDSAIDDEEIELLNRKIEYSILQQLIYREKASTVPNSRFRRIIHIDDEKLKCLSFHGVLFIVAILIAFEPSWLIVDSIYNILNFGFWNIIPDTIAVCYILYVLFVILGYVIKSYSNSKLNKLNLKDGEIELKEENSIFNKHLDEILYFFQVTKYNVVIIEDLDRFGTSKIFLKLRELNQLINESKIVGRNVVFLYAVKDDIFINEERTKFFDYITTVIPVINPSNSKDKLKEALKEREIDENEIKDVDLADMAFFIQDMRILINIANEFSQYRQKLLANGQKLNLTKLLAMIVYKNYFPKDFAQLHRREGYIYKCINSKLLFVKGAMEYLSVKEKEIEEDYQLYLQNKHLKESELSYLYMDAVRQELNPRLCRIHVKDNYYSLKTIADNKELFNEFLKLDSISYEYFHYSSTYTNSGSVNHKKIDKSLDFNKRMSVMNSSEQTFARRRSLLRREKLKIQSQTIKELIGKYKQGETDTYKNLGLSEMMDVFIRRGFIDEEYYDYISYFYEGMVSLSDRDLLLSIKRNIVKEYTYHIDKMENFVKELLPYMFESDAILNNDLLNFLAKKNKYSDYFNQVMFRLEKDEAPLDFLSQYYMLGKSVETVFNHYISWDRIKSWQNITNWNDEEERNYLIEGWFKYCGKIEKEPLQWLNSNYIFLSERCERIGMKRCKGISDNCLFESINATNVELLKYVAENSTFSLNAHNICVIVNSMQTVEIVDEHNLNLSRIHLASCEELLDYVKENISDALNIFSSTCKDESAESILYILNEENLSTDEKEDYLQNQRTRLDNMVGIEKDDSINLAFKLFLIKPSWENVEDYNIRDNKDNSILYAYIEHYSSELSTMSASGIYTRNSNSTIFTHLFSTDALDINTFKKVVGAFNREFLGCKALATLDAQRLMILLDKGKLPFNDSNTEILKNTSIYADYLLLHHAKFYAIKDSSYFTTVEVANKIMESNLFTKSQKNYLIPIIPNDILKSSQILADNILGILIDFDLKVLNEGTLKSLWGNASQIPLRVRVLTQMIKDFNYSGEQMIELLNILGEEYKDIAERTKRPVLKDAEWNNSLAAILKEKGFISSYKMEKDGIRIIPKRIK